MVSRARPPSRALVHKLIAWPRRLAFGVLRLGWQEKHEGAVAIFPRPISPEAPKAGLAVATNDLVTCGGTAVGTIEAHVQCTGDESAAAVACRGDGLKYQGVCESPATQASLYERGLASRRSRELGLLVWEIV
eukprot:scaffold60941_cov55-Phaeocystis_antarctica.AAC.1